MYRHAPVFGPAKQPPPTVRKSPAQHPGLPPLPPTSAAGQQHQDTSSKVLLNFTNTSLSKTIGQRSDLLSPMSSSATSYMSATETLDNQSMDSEENNNNRVKSILHEESRTPVAPVSEPSQRENDVRSGSDTQEVVEETHLKASKSDHAETSRALTNENFLRINIGGKSFKILKSSVLNRSNESRLSRIVKCGNLTTAVDLADGYIEETRELYFDRSPCLAPFIIDYYYTGQLHFTDNVCEQRLLSELAYWQIDIASASNAECSCVKPRKTVEEKDEPPVHSISVAMSRKQTIKKFEGQYLAALRARVYLLCENPRSSLAASIYSAVSISFVGISVLGLVLASMKEFQQLPVDRGTNSSDSLNFSATYRRSSASRGMHIEAQPIPALQHLELICILFFTFELFLRAFAAPSKRAFFSHYLNVIDLFTVFPFYVERILATCFNVTSDELSRISGALMVMRALRVARVARVFKLARYSTGLQSFANTMGQSMRELTMLGMFLVTAIIFFSTVMHFIEKDEPKSDFTSIPQACWWCIITMTTVGYGDIVPVTPVGKIVAAMASISGIIVLAFPISMIVDKFAQATLPLEMIDDELSSSEEVSRAQQQQQQQQQWGGGYPGRHMSLSRRRTMRLQRAAASRTASPTVVEERQFSI